MDSTLRKRKDGPGPANSTRSAHKKSKGGSAGRWKTPHQKAKIAEKVELGTTLAVGDQGIWVTHARGMQYKAIKEFTELCVEYGRTMYGIEPQGDDEENAAGDEHQDIEASIEAELSIMKSSGKRDTNQTFKPVSSGVECLFFMKTMDPVQPEFLARKMCEDARDCQDQRQRKCKYINRLTPVVNMDKATDNGIVKVARTVLLPWFELKDEEGDNSDKTEAPDPAGPRTPYTYAIRHNIRNHTTFKSGEVIQKVAGLIDAQHSVNLGKPDKVILVEIFQLFCGISVVDGKEWEELKRYNMNELYSLPPVVSNKE
ncbi:THUMP domain containing protein [Metarhizium album ARSEF 1941]|uniref:THUMP domain containing protein n=1 Tax=Metarhizium album (strain ARSEF 1941) TaxID=1081103 RepID=A0A0B2X714_METAS|nr:THUMP domain containing protein [Metarhizium album ARSEF 1941]KHO01096.1 THUMP domain containing protein [Metarhizium album ARSEF 1941]